MSTAQTIKTTLVMIGYYAFCGAIGYLGGLAVKAILEKIAD